MLSENRLRCDRIVSCFIEVTKWMRKSNQTKNAKRRRETIRFNSWRLHCAQCVLVINDDDFGRKKVNRFKWNCNLLFKKCFLTVAADEITIWFFVSFVDVFRCKVLCLWNRQSNREKNRSYFMNLQQRAMKIIENVRTRSTKCRSQRTQTATRKGLTHTLRSTLNSTHTTFWRRRQKLVN